MAGLTPDQVTAIRKVADKEGITIKNTSEGRKNLDMIRKRLGFRSGGSVSISDRDVAKMKEMLSGFTKNKPSYKGTKSSSANSISDKDVAKTKEMINKFRDKEKTKGMKDGGMVGSSISNFKGTY
jgi:hypothetical protein